MLKDFCHLWTVNHQISHLLAMKTNLVVSRHEIKQEGAAASCQEVQDVVFNIFAVFNLSFKEIMALLIGIL